jgi:hypothetical protein
MRVLNLIAALAFLSGCATQRPVCAARLEAINAPASRPNVPTTATAPGQPGAITDAQIDHSSRS